MESKNKFQLTNEELNELVGGNAPDRASGDINNNNGVSGCVCSYNNAPSAINNNNSVIGCKCECTGALPF